MNIHYYYSLTQRQFVNIVNGYRRKEDLLSRERWHISRKIMYAYMCKYLGENGMETDIISFPWERKMLKKMTEEELLKAETETEESKLFWAKWDERNKGKA